MSELTEAQQQDVFQYYITFKTFFEATDSNKDRSSSTRAQKARAKLLKLSPLQFYELSTDVSDELNRRIDEDQDQPEYLLPKASFHVKRNQARQKLAKLSQTRFNDLIDDILYEIYRRGYDRSKDKAKTDEPTHEQQVPAEENELDNHEKTREEGNVDEQPNNDTTTSSSVQPLLVIPKKASIDWSSDEEEPHNEEETSPMETKSKDISNMIENTFQKAADIQENEYKESPVLQQKSESDLNDTPDLNKDSESNFNSKDKVYESNNVSFEYDQPHDNYSTTNDFQSLYKSAEDFSDSKDLDADVTTDSVDKGVKTLDSTTSVEERYQKDFIQLNSEIRDLSIENEQLKQRISELEIEIKSPSKAKRTESNLQPLDTKKVLQKLMDENILNDVKNLENYFDANGYISVDVVQNIRENVNQIYSIIYENYNSKRDNYDINGKLLFKHMAQISDSVAKVLNMVDLPEFNDQTVILKAAISHAITTLRYYTTYGPLIPVITLQASITEVLFAFCTIVKSAKIKVDDKKTLFDEFGSRQKTDSSADKESVPNFPSTPVVGEKQGSTPFFEKPKDVDSFLDHGEESPVKPLKITQKAINSPKIPPATTSRKPSGTGLFSLKIDTKSMDALSKLNEDSNELDANSTPSKSKTINEDNVMKGGDLGVVTPAKESEKNEEEDKKDTDKAQTTEDKKIEQPVLTSKEPIPESKNSNVDEEKNLSDINKAQSNNIDLSSGNIGNEAIQTPKENGFPVFGTIERASLKKVDLASPNSNSSSHSQSTTNDSKDTKPSGLGIIKNMDEIPEKKKSDTQSDSELESDSSYKYEPIKKEVDLNQSGVDTNINHGDGEKGATNSEIATEKETKIIEGKEATETNKKETLKPTENKDKISEAKETVGTVPNKKDNILKNEQEESEESEEEESEEEDDSEDNESEDDDEDDQGDEDDDNEQGSDINFDIDAFDIENPDNTLSELLLYLEHQTMQVISTIQSLLTSIKEPQATKGNLRTESNAINGVIWQMVDATSVSMNQSRNANLKEHGSWVVQSLEDCAMRLTALCKLKKDGQLLHEENDEEYADKNFKQRLAGIAFDVAKCTKELVKTVEEASLKEEIDYLNARLN